MAAMDGNQTPDMASDASVVVTDTLDPEKASKMSGNSERIMNSSVET